MIGLMGAHRVGKTTLCKKLTDSSMGYSEVEISISEMQRGMGYDSANQSYDWETRKKIQSRLLTLFGEILRDSANLTGVLRMQHVRIDITERTPLDLVGYLLLNAPEHVSKEDAEWIMNYINACIALTNEYYSKVILVQPGIAYVDSEKSAGEDTMDKLNAIYLSVLMDGSLTVDRVVIPSEMTDLDERMNFILRGIYAKS